MKPLTRSVLGWLLDNPEASEDQLTEVGGETLKEIHNGEFKDSYKLALLIEIRSKIKTLADENHPLLQYIPIDQELIDRVQKTSQEKVWEKIDQKILISSPEYVAMCEKMLEHNKLSFIVLGLALATGRRYSELRASNFKLSDNESELFFSGQLKKRGRAVKPYPIPLLVKRKLVLKGLVKLSESGQDIEEKNFQHHVWTLSNWFFGHTIHDLRAKYCSLILAREGLLEKESRREPLIRAKELLGHEGQSNATYAYRGYAVTDKVSQERLKELLAKIESYKEDVIQGRRFGENNIVKVLESLYEPTDALMPWRNFQRTYLIRYKNATGKSLWKQKLNQFFYQKRDEELSALIE